MMNTVSAERPPQRAFFVVSGLVFAISVAITMVRCSSMSATAGMPMPGGWTMSMAWMRMPGETWLGAAASFLGMWEVMMVAMMMPSLTPMLWRYRETISRSGAPRLGGLTILVGVGYFAVWTIFGIAAFAIGSALTAITMQRASVARAVPIAAGLVVLFGGLLQFTAWKARHLACCSGPPPSDDIVHSGSALRHGMRLGPHCTQCCAGLILILLVIGLMDIRAMAVVTGAITLERLAPASKHVAQAVGGVTMAIGLFLIARAGGLA